MSVAMIKCSSPRIVNHSAFTLVEIMIVVLIIGILLGIAVPNFIRARETSRSKACIANLKQVDTAKEQYAMDQKLSERRFSSVARRCAERFSSTLSGSDRLHQELVSSVRRAERTPPATSAPTRPARSPPTAAAPSYAPHTAPVTAQSRLPHPVSGSILKPPADDRSSPRGFAFAVNPKICARE